MSAFKPIMTSLALLILPAGFLFTSVANAQVRIEIPEMRMPPIRGGMGAIMDIQSFGSSSSVSMTVENGVKKIRAVEDGVKTYIEDDPHGGIVVKITKQYGSEQMDELMEEYPDLYMYMKDFPSETDEAEVEVTLGVTRKYEATDEEDLKERHPEAFESYKKYTSGGQAMPFMRRGVIEIPGVLSTIPELRLVPPVVEGGTMEIKPGDIRIHEDEDSSKEKSKSEDKDT